MNHVLFFPHKSRKLDRRITLASPNEEKSPTFCLGVENATFDLIFLDEYPWEKSPEWTKFLRSMSFIERTNKKFHDFRENHTINRCFVDKTWQFLWNFDYVIVRSNNRPNQR